MLEIAKKSIKAVSKKKEARHVMCRASEVCNLLCTSLILEVGGYSPSASVYSLTTTPCLRK